MPTTLLKIWLTIPLAAALAGFLLFPAAAGADNIAANPSAEQVAADGTPVGWGMYVGAGRIKLSAPADQKHSGQRSACLDLMGWYTPPGAADVPAQHSVSGAIVLAPNNGYGADGALACHPGDSYAFSFWYQGTVPSASVSATGWPSAKADDTQRIGIAVSGAALVPSGQWQRCTGRLRIPKGVERFVVLIQASGKQDAGFALGKLYVDDAVILPHNYPDGELRAVWCAFPKANDRDAALREMATSLDRLKSAGLNAIFVWTHSRYLAALDRPELQKSEPQARWDALGELIQAAKKRGIQVHMWYAPWTYKSSGGVELADHPDWACVSAQGVASKDGLCLVRPEVRRYELELIGRTIDHYPDLAGVHMEEPGFDWGPDFCYCDHCRKFCQQNFSTDIRQKPPAAKAMLNNLAAFMGSDFFARLREMATQKRPELWVSANGSGGANPDWYLGRDWTTWARRGYLDFYVPQLYCQSVEPFVKQGEATRSCLGECDMVTGMAVSWSGIYPARQPSELIAAQIAAARKLGAKGFCVFHQDYFNDAHFRAIRATIEAKSGAAAR